MKNEFILDREILEEFQKQAKKRRRNPGNLVTNWMREQLEIWEDEKLFHEMQEEGRTSVYTEDDTVELVWQYRREKRKPKQAKAHAAT